MRNSLALVVLLLSVFAGCVPVSRKDADIDSEVDKKVTGGVEEGEANRVVWVETGIAREDVAIDLGYRFELADGARWIEPIAIVRREGASVANAMVFNSLASASGSELIAEEVATAYVPSPGSGTAWYAQGRLPVPAGISQFLLRFRIVLPDSPQPWTRGLPIKLE